MNLEYPWIYPMHGVLYLLKEPQSAISMIAKNATANESA